MIVVVALASIQIVTCYLIPFFLIVSLSFFAFFS